MVKRPTNNMAENKRQVRDSKNAGFMVTSVRSFHTGEERANPASNFTDEVWMTTPYILMADVPVVARCNVQHRGVDMDMLVSSLELYATKRDCKTPDEHVIPETVMMRDSNGKGHLYEEVVNGVADCAAATVQFPHVMTYDEYVDFAKKNLNNLNIAVTEGCEGEYTKYLSHCENEMQSGNMFYVGKVQNPDSVLSLQMDMPSAQQGYQDSLTDTDIQLE